MASQVLLKSNNLFSSLNLLREIIVVKTNGRSWARQVTVKAKDAYLVKDASHGDIVKLGRLLGLLAKHGLATKANGRRPVRWVLKRSVIEWAYFCNLKCFNDSSICGLYGICPYHIVLGESIGNFN